MDAKTKYFERNAMRTSQASPLPDDIRVGYYFESHEVKFTDDYDPWDINDLYITSNNPSVIYTYSTQTTDDEGNIDLRYYIIAVNTGTTTIGYSEIDNGTVQHYTFPVTVQKGYPTAEIDSMAWP